MPDSTHLPDPVERALETWLRHHDRLTPGLIEGVYLVGSVALDDWRPGSDIDIIAFTSDAVNDNQIDALRAAHQATAEELGGIDIDGPRLQWGDVAEPPEPIVRPWTLGWEFHHDDQCFELNPVMWHALAVHGRPVRGPQPGEIEISTEPDDLLVFVRTNSASYWRSVAESVETASHDPSRSEFKPEMTSWCVLGIARMLFTVRTGGVASKTAAGRWLAAELPEHRPLIEHGLNIRHGGSASPDDRATAIATARYMREIIELIAAS